MIKFTLNLTIKRTAALACAIPLSLSLTMCKPSKEEKNTTETSKPSQPISSPQQLAAEKVIQDDPDVQLVEVIGDKIIFSNVHSGLGVELPFQDIIDGKYDMVKGGVAEASKVLSPLRSGRLGHPDFYAIDPWGKSPPWIPRYPDLQMDVGAIHGPKQDGSIWGQISGSHKDSFKQIRDFIVLGFQEAHMPLSMEKSESHKTTLFFETTVNEDDKDQENRKVKCIITRMEPRTHINIQYTYGM